MAGWRLPACVLVVCVDGSRLMGEREAGRRKGMERSRESNASLGAWMDGWVDWLIRKRLVEIGRNPACVSRGQPDDDDGSTRRIAQFYLRSSSAHSGLLLALTAKWRRLPGLF